VHVIGCRQRVQRYLSCNSRGSIRNLVFPASFAPTIPLRALVTEIDCERATQLHETVSKPHTGVHAVSVRWRLKTIASFNVAEGMSKKFNTKPSKNFLYRLSINVDGTIYIYKAVELVTLLVRYQMNMRKIMLNMLVKHSTMFRLDNICHLIVNASTLYIN
jgi:hypothetical protein